MGRRISRILSSISKSIPSIRTLIPAIKTSPKSQASLLSSRWRLTPGSAKLSISHPQLDPIYYPYRDLSNATPISIHGYAVPARFFAEHTAIFLDTLPIGDFKRLGQLVIMASVGRLGHLSLLPDSDHLIMVAVTKLKGIERGSYQMDNDLRLRLIYFLVNRYGAYFRYLNQLYPDELGSLVSGSHRCHPLAVL